ncbi:unnamed protein product [Paramecium octaurelia]|uniref:Uncharacterized protein n=1 Tax=Paramecium octaurelia TaxID=43137 RepID=A0A8S1WCM9_PAROT|nr:unnamed protein product [Paramecium octaurelia]
MLINLLGQVRKIMSSKSDVGKLISYITIRATQNKNLSEIWTRARSFGEESRHTIVKTCNNTKNMDLYWLCVTVFFKSTFKLTSIMKTFIEIGRTNSISFVSNQSFGIMAILLLNQYRHSRINLKQI